MGNHAAEIRAQRPGLPITRRGRNWIEFLRPDGKFETVFTLDPLHYGATNDQEISEDVVADTGAWQWKMVGNRFQLHGRNVLNAGDIVQWLDTGSGQSVTAQPLALNWVDNVTDSRQQLALPQAVAASGIGAGNVLTWTNGYGTGRHYRYTSHPRRLLKELILDGPGVLPAPTVSNPWLELEFIVSRSSGLTYYVDGVAWDNSTKRATANRIEVRLTATGEVLWYFEAPTATDAAGNICPGVLQLRRQGANRYCTVRFPKSWVDAAVFPIRLDPTFTDGPGGDVTTSKDTRIINGIYADTNYGGNVALDLGAYGEIYRGLIQFDVSGIPAGSTIQTATMNLTRTYNEGDNGGTMYAYRCLRAWVEAEATWNVYSTGNSWGTAGCANTTSDREADAIGSWASGATAAVSLTASLVEEWLDGVLANNGMLLKATTESGNNITTWASSDHATAGYRPTLVVVYTAAGGANLLALLGVG